MPKHRVILCPVGNLAFEATEDPWEFAKKRLEIDTVEVVCLEDGVVILCDENSIAKALPINRLVPARMPEIPEGMTVIDTTDGDHPAPGELGVHQIRGDFVLTRYGVDDNESDWADLTQADIDKWLPLLNGGAP